MSGLKAAAPGGAVEQLVPPHEIREMFLDIAPEKPDPPESDGDDVPQPAAMSLPDETDPQIQEMFRDAYLDEWNPELHPRDDDGKFTSVSGSLDEITDLTNKVKNGDMSDTTARRKMGDLVREETDVNASFRTLPQEIEKSARAAQELIRLSETEDLSGLDRFVVSGTSDDLKGLRGVASGRYKIRERKIVINPDQFEQGIVDDWNESGHAVGTKPESIIRHELGHYLHGEKVAPLNPDADVSWEDTKEEFDDETADRVEEELGGYAAVMPGEFIAEAYTYQKEGGTLSDELQELYESYNGPEVN
jgi:predicted Zn-dependent protease with MMP-like domain